MNTIMRAKARVEFEMTSPRKGTETRTNTRGSGGHSRTFEMTSPRKGTETHMQGLFGGPGCPV